MPRRAMLQDARASASDPAVICSFDYEAIDKPTRAIIHQGGTLSLRKARPRKARH